MISYHVPTSFHVRLLYSDGVSKRTEGEPIHSIRAQGMNGGLHQLLVKVTRYFISHGLAGQTNEWLHLDLPLIRHLVYHRLYIQ